ncbi:type II toxin-antitoxin system VapC family toxin [Methanocalculus chunghsingensis]|uniref:type II toxin-antitoxin system VapC family toxin n=1 Tax=Methanocalculus chunghsingensis TaxID=156457 RepID=UPI001B8C1F11|nr:PIN domain-containing protein [Methanocalculus chunghsingensis]
MGLNLQLLLKDKTAIALDTALFIYLIEENPTYIRFVEPIFLGISRGAIQACTSTITLIEVLTKPLEENNTELIQKYCEIMSDSANLFLSDVDREIAVESARLRAAYSLRTPDAIQ